MFVVLARILKVALPPAHIVIVLLRLKVILPQLVGVRSWLKLFIQLKSSA